MIVEFAHGAATYQVIGAGAGARPHLIGWVGAEAQGFVGEVVGHGVAHRRPR